ncbi:acidic leucine-rich nuclear phosphoprotein 32 family member A-like [Chironomus tepperi]|uniref:acidic leucine-rich nuclear phosphoprotein 32 family member A-like n=1 Tax=Chironomus tepperi TaxID=113505 RepID=UPI00391F8207
MEARIALELENKRPNQIKKLNLDGCISTSIEGLSNAFYNLVELSINNVGLTSIENFPELRSLKKLELVGNKISDGLMSLKACPELKILNLSSNNIENFNELKPLRKLRKLEILDLDNNHVQMIRYFREKVFYIIKSLKYLDGFDENDIKCPSDDDAESSCSESSLVSVELNSNTEEDSDHESEKSWDYEYFDELPEEKKREILAMVSASRNNSDSDNLDSDTSSSSSSSSSLGSTNYSNLSSWEDLSCDINLSNEPDLSKDEWIDISTDISKLTDEE